MVLRGSRWILRVALVVGPALLAGSGASAQTSLFAQPPAAGVEAAPAEATTPKRPARPAKTGTPARVLAVTNASESTLTALEVSGDGKSATLAKAVAPKGKASLRLPVLKGCLVTVAARFEDGDAEPTTQDICRDRTLVFRD